MEWVNKYAENLTCDDRHVLQAMVSIVNDITGFAVKMLKENGMWDNAIACGGVSR